MRSRASYPSLTADHRGAVWLEWALIAGVSAIGIISGLGLASKAITTVVVALTAGR